MTQSFTFFWKDRSPFSNWYPSKFTHNNVTFSRSEQYMMYRKAMLFGDMPVAAAILLTDNPKEQKDLGRMVSNYVDSVWVDNRVDIMVEGLFQKFTQNPDLAEKLLNTGNTTIVEASPVDKIWGIGLGESHPDATNPLKWRGQNLLGITLMRVRDAIRQL